MDQANFTREVLYIHLDTAFVHTGKLEQKNMVLLGQEEENVLIEDILKYDLRESATKGYLGWRRIRNTGNLEDVTDTQED